MSDRPKAPQIVLVGPTASAKSSTAVELASLLAHSGLPCEVVSADSMQVYRGMDIGTAKPTLEQRRGIAHHMIDVVNPTENYNVSRYCQEACRVVTSLRKREVGIIVAGGTGLYVKALIDGLSGAPGADRETRSRLEKQAEELGHESLYRRLQEVDPIVAKKIDPRNVRRVIRALEVFEISGEPLSAFHRRQKAPPWQKEFQWFGLQVPFYQLDARIEARTNKMFEQGLVAEVEQLLAQGSTLEQTSMQGLGYKEVATGLAQGLSAEEMRNEVIRRTCRYSRRQMTWWRPEKRINWLSTGDMSTTHQTACEILKKLRLSNF